jgi:hypothetical protein
MDRALWDSVPPLLDEAGAVSPEEDAPADTAGIPAPTGLLDYAAYFDLDASVRRQDPPSDAVRARAVARLHERLAQAIPLEPLANPPRITNYTLACYPQDQLDQMSRWWDTEPANRIALTGIDDAAYLRSCRAIEQALRYLREAAPALHAEVEIVVRDIVLAQPDGSHLMDYGGASSFALWGAITLNAEAQRDWTQVYTQIVHETGHNLLFALARNEPLVTAEPATRLRSPIRADARPVDGIFHAAYVSAREALALESLLRWDEAGGDLPPQDVDPITDALEASVLAFWDCVETLRRDTGSLTELGAAVLADCESYMSATFALEPC